MVGAIEFFGVEWVGDKEPVLFQLAPLLGSIFVAAAAAYAAHLAASTANKRQREQLDRDAERHREQLEHDTERQREELAHDRNIRKQEHSRDAVDGAVEAVGEAQKAVASAEGGAEWLESHRDEIQPVLVDEEADNDQRDSVETELAEKRLEFRRELIDARGKIVAMFPPSVRLGLRLGVTHAITEKFDALSDAWHELLGTLDGVAEHNRSSDEIEATEAAGRKANSCYSALMVACEHWLREP